MKLTKIIATALLTVSVAQVYAACTPPGTLVDEWADPKDPEWTIGLNWINRTTYLWCDPVSNRDIYVEGPRRIDGCDAGLLMFESGYVCRSMIPPRPEPRPDPEPIYVPPADAVCFAEYLRPEFESCAPGYFSTNKGTHDGDTWCVPTAAQITLCTPIYPPPEPDPGPGHDYGHQIGYRGPDGQLHETRDPNSAPCSGCKDGGPTDTKEKPETTDTSPPSPPGDGSTDGNTDGDGTGGE